VELIDPSLLLRLHPPAAQRLAGAIITRAGISRTSTSRP
jgi:hypothetical protein